jgi:H+/Cl- antiporter ClcA
MKAILRWLHPSSWHVIFIFLMLGVFAGLFAWFSFNLIHYFMANIRYITQYGALALREGGLRQALELAGTGYLAIVFYVYFKACEVELVVKLRERAGARGPHPKVD